MANEKNQLSEKKSRGSAATEPKNAPDAPVRSDAVDDLRYMDDLLAPGVDINRVSAVGKPREFQRALARELMWQSDECPSFVTAISLAVRAVRIDAASLDARVFLAMLADGPRDEYIEELRQIVAVGEDDLGAKCFKENYGHFWLVMETRPYMRARLKLAEALHDAQRTDEAIAEYEALLALNPGDNLGLRYRLLGCYLEEEQLEGARRLFQQYGMEETAFFTWAHVLERYLAGDIAGAIEALATARGANSHVEAFLTRKKKLPKTRPEYYRPRGVSEAVFCVDEIGGAWNRHPEAIRWLKKEHGSGLLFFKERQSKGVKGKPN